jgi:catechol 2,3-dioxygenase-like lactoylglutathione lyase family enzyme
MSTTEARHDTGTDGSGATVDLNLEVVIIAVSDVDRAKSFYDGLGWRLDADLGSETFRLVQFTPPASGCSIQFGIGLTSATPGSAINLLAVSDIVAAHDDLVSRGAVDATEVFHDVSGGYNRFDPDLRADGPDPQGRSYASFMEFRDPDGNVWQLQEITTRLPGRVDSATATYGSVGDLRTALQRAAAAHGEHEERIGQADENWPEWYAAYMLAEQTGGELPS